MIRDERVILDRDLAELYGVPTKILNQAVKRNEERFPDDFAFRLTDAEIANLKSQFVTSSSGHGGVRKPPLAFTEHGAIMAATILNSPRAVEMSIFVVRAFIRIRELADQHSEIAKRLTALEEKSQAMTKTCRKCLRRCGRYYRHQTSRNAESGSLAGATRSNRKDGKVHVTRHEHVNLALPACVARGARGRPGFQSLRLCYVAALRLP
ncbi:MAG TPA: ORF6N domain-containing protein [Thermoanaerobaculia bacterium]|jgi:hypothetical protein|nr:ORF6N domain-containing protein [Thermoanaerobaculia bacterium]